MKYFNILNFDREPFSNTPDPDLFFKSSQQTNCLQQLELSIRLKRGLNVVIGDIGVGKTTICWQLIRRLAKDSTIETHLILDPFAESELQFLQMVATSLGIQKSFDQLTTHQLKELIKSQLFQRGVDKDKTVLLIIDEGQKLPKYCLEALRELLNYEADDCKLLQILIFAQNELESNLRLLPNLIDRINLFFRLSNLNFSDARALIHHRMNIASSGRSSSVAFSYMACWLVYYFSKGYPRKIINICHQVLLALIVKNRLSVGAGLVLSVVSKRLPLTQLPTGKSKFAMPLVVAATLTVTVAFTLLFQNGNMMISESNVGQNSISPTRLLLTKIPSEDGGKAPIKFEKDRAIRSVFSGRSQRGLRLSYELQSKDSLLIKGMRARVSPDHKLAVDPDLKMIESLESMFNNKNTKNLQLSYVLMSDEQMLKVRRH